MKTTIKRALSILLIAVILISSTVFTNASNIRLKAETRVYDSIGGETIGFSVWTLYNDGTLVISGEGIMLGAPPKAFARSSVELSDGGIIDEVKKIIIEDGITSIAIGFNGGSTMGSDGPQKLEEVEIADSVTSIEDSVFARCRQLKKVKLPKNLETISASTFYGCSNLETVIMPENCTKIGELAFALCTKLKHIYLPESITTIERAAFSDCCSLVGIKLPDGLKQLATSSFLKCKNLKSISIPENVKKIGRSTFGGCDNLEYIMVNGKNTEISENCGLGVDALWRAGSLTKLGHTVIFGYKGSDAQTKSALLENTFIPLDKGSSEHYYTYEKITKKPTCEAEGEKELHCPCGHVEIKPIGKTNEHKYKKYTAKATMKKDGAIGEKCTLCGTESPKKTVISKIKSVKLSKTSFTYTGKAQKPTVTVKDSKGKTLKQGTDYTVEYSKGCKNPGQYTVTVKFKGNYDGEQTLTFKIIPKGTSISSLSAGSKRFTVKWKKQSTQTSGYEIRYSTSSKMKNAKTVTVSKNSTTSKTIKNLKASKTFYVQIRTFKTVKINGKNTTLYSSWSSAKKIKTK